MVALKAWQALFEHGCLQPRQRIIVQTGAGGVDYAKVDSAARIAEPVDIVLDSTVAPSTLGTGEMGEIGVKNYSVLRDAGTDVSGTAFAIGQYPRVRGIDARFFQAVPSRADFETIVRHMQDKS